MLVFRCLQLRHCSCTLRLIERHNLRSHLYADDTQIYVRLLLTHSSRSTPATGVCVHRRCCCVDAQSNRLQLNTAQTELLWCPPSRRQHQLPQVALGVSTDYVSPKASSLVRDLGIYVDSDVSMKIHVSKTCQAASPFYASCAAFDDGYHQQFCSHWSFRLCCHDWTTATSRCTVCPAITSTDCSQS